VDQLADIVKPALEAKGIQPDNDTLVQAMEALRERSSDINALVDGTMFLWTSSPIEISDDAKQHLDSQILKDLDEMLVCLAWNKEQIELQIKGYVEFRGIKLKTVAACLRSALTGRTTSPPIFDVLVLLGMEETIKRMRAANEALSKM
jgi:glutamyl-tRNA synthetase